MKTCLSSILLFAFLSIGNITIGQDAQSLVNKGYKLTQSGSYDEAMTAFNEALAMDPEFMDAYVRRAFVHSVLKDYEKAVVDYTKVIELNPKFVQAYLSRGSAFNKLDKFETAMDDFNMVIEIDPKNSEAYNNRGWSKKGLGDKEGACQDWKTSKKMGNEEAKIILKNNQC